MRYDVPQLYRSSVQPSKVFTQAVMSSDRLITLGGPCGAGKTWDACAWLNHCKSKGYDVAYIRATDLPRLEYIDMVDLERAKVLCIDDYGKQQTQGALSRASDIVEKRIGFDWRYTIITTNILSDLRRLDERLASRLNAGRIINYEGMPDRRQKN